MAVILLGILNKQNQIDAKKVVCELTACSLSDSFSSWRPAFILTTCQIKSVLGIWRRKESLSSEDWKEHVDIEVKSQDICLLFSEHARKILLARQWVWIIRWQLVRFLQFPLERYLILSMALGKDTFCQARSSYCGHHGVCQGIIGKRSRRRCPIAAHKSEQDFGYSSSPGHVYDGCFLNLTSVCQP